MKLGHQVIRVTVLYISLKSALSRHTPAPAFITSWRSQPLLPSSPSSTSSSPSKKSYLCNIHSGKSLSKRHMQQWSYSNVLRISKFSGKNSGSKWKSGSKWNLFTHTKATSPYLDTSSSSYNSKRDGDTSNNSINNTDDNADSNDDSSGIANEESLKELCQLLKATPQDLLYLKSESDGDDGERGVYTSRSVDTNDIILQIPLSSCIRDDKPPLWYDAFKSLHRNHDVDSTNFHYNPSKWATRLAASLLDLQIRLDSFNNKNDNNSSNSHKNGNNDNESDANGGYSQSESEQSGNVMIGLQKWLSMMPDEDFLRASLPIHWPEEIIPYAKCTALELSIDASYFARAEALSDLLSAININVQSTSESVASDTDSDSEDMNDIDFTSWESMGINIEEYDLERMSSNVFDIVQTRSCRAERTGEDGIQLRPSVRVLAPIFDFINHGSHRHNGEGCANAFFGLEGGKNKNHGNGDSYSDDDLSLVVRALTKIEEGEEILIDYGDSTRPAWRCLASYGFVPEYRLTSPDDELEEGEEDESVAEVFMDGGRYEVGSHTVPFEMVEAASAAFIEEQQGVRAFGNVIANDDDDVFGNENEENGADEAQLTPEIALRIAKRVSDAAFQLLIEPSSSLEDQGSGSGANSDDEATLIAKQLAASLRWSQHQCLLACAMGLRDYAARSTSTGNQ